MKKLVSMFIVAMMSLSCLAFFGGCTPRGEILKIYNWGEYMSQEAIDGFADWYKAETGKKIKVQYSEYVDNEKLYSTIYDDKADYDIACPSEYMVDKMRKENLLLEIDKGIVNNLSDIRADLLQIAASVDVGNKYSIPYIWGTLGVMYDSTMVDHEYVDNNGWMSLFQELPIADNEKRIFMKNGVRDAYAIANIVNHRDQLLNLSNQPNSAADYKTLLDKTFGDTSDASIAAVGATLKAQKKLKSFNRFENDDGKIEMMNKTADRGYLGLFWSCDAGYAMIGDDQNAGNKDLFYHVPYEGSNVYVDSMVIPKFSKNSVAANYFLKYLNTKDVAIKNMEYVGAPAVVTAAMDEYKATLEADEDGFFEGTATNFKEMFLEMMFPTEEVIARCGVMKDFANETAKIQTMWVDVTAE